MNVDIPLTASELRWVPMLPCAGSFEFGDSARDLLIAAGKPITAAESHWFFKDFIAGLKASEG